jgi:hypothetical protein
MLGGSSAIVRMLKRSTALQNGLNTLQDTSPGEQSLLHEHRVKGRERNGKHTVMPIDHVLRLR